MSNLTTYLLLHNYKEVSLFDFEISKSLIIWFHNFTVGNKLEGIGVHAVDLMNLFFQLPDLSTYQQRLLTVQTSSTSRAS